MGFVTIFESTPRHEIERELNSLAELLADKEARLMDRARAARRNGNVKQYNKLRRQAKPYGEMLWALMARFPPF